VPETFEGTGFIISEAGYVITASHVVPKTDQNTAVITTGAVRSRHGQAVTLEPVRRDDEVDVLMLMFPDVGTKWKPVKFGNSKTVPIEAELIALGFPSNLDLSSANGRLSSKFSRQGRWQTTMPINPGNSGGPIFDITGKVVAIAVSGDTSKQGVTFAIPESYAGGLIQMASLTVPAFFTSVDRLKYNEKFVSVDHLFYKTVDHSARVPVNEKYCLPEEYVIATARYEVASFEGSETKVESIIVDPQNKNCALLRGVIQGSGTKQIGPITVDQFGRGGLGVKVMIEGKIEEMRQRK
jgi:hypothetical protein